MSPRLRLRAKRKSPNRRRQNRNRLNHKWTSGKVGDNYSPLNRSLRRMRTVVEDAGEAAVVEAGAVVELKQVGLPDTLKPILLQSKISPEQLLHQQRE